MNDNICAAYNDVWKDTIDAIAVAGFNATAWQTGGSCVNLTLALTEAGFNGPVAMMGVLGADISSTETGCCVLAHDWQDADGTKFYEECYAYESGCAACFAIAPVADKINGDISDDATLDQYTEWVISAAKSLAKAVAEHPVHSN